MTFRLFAALLALLLLASITATAGAAVHVKQEKKSPEAIAAYWTKARMQNAKPVERARPGGGGGGAKAGAAVAVPFPYAGADRTNGKVFFTLGGADYVCSGTAATSTTTGVNLVWTAGHCVADSATVVATNFDFVPAYYRGDAPYGHWGGTDIYSTAGWLATNDFDYDLGAVRVTRAGVPGASLQATVGTRSVTTGYNAAQQQFRSYGYPAQGKFNGASMYMCSSGLLRRDGTRATAPMAIACDMTGGSSGGGWITAGGQLASVNSYGYSGVKNTMFGPYQGAVAQDLYDRAR